MKHRKGVSPSHKQHFQFGKKLIMSGIGNRNMEIFVFEQDFWICHKIRNQNIACSLLENVGHRFRNSEILGIENRNIDMFVFEHRFSGFLDFHT